MANVSRQTIYDDKKKGKLSIGRDSKGKPYIDAAELERVYGQLYGPEPSEGVNTGQIQTGKKDSPDSALQREVDFLKEERERERRQFEATIDDLRRRLDGSEQERREVSRQLTALLTDQRTEKSSQKVPRSRLARAWSILRGVPG